MNSNSIRLQWTGAIVLALIAGYLDGYGFLFLKTYVSFMSGNTTSAGVLSGGGHFDAAFNSVLAVSFFVTGSFCGTLLCQSKLAQARRLCFGAIAGILAAVAALESNGFRNIPVEIALLCLAMAMVNPALTKIGAEPVSLTFMTGTLNRIGGHLASAAGRKPLPEAQGGRDSHLRRAGIDAGVWFGFVGGAALSGMVDPSLQRWALLPPFFVMVVLTLLSDRHAPSAGYVARPLPPKTSPIDLSTH